MLSPAKLVPSTCVPSSMKLLRHSAPLLIARSTENRGSMNTRIDWFRVFWITDVDSNASWISRLFQFDEPCRFFCKAFSQVLKILWQSAIRNNTVQEAVTNEITTQGF